MGAAIFPDGAGSDKGINGPCAVAVIRGDGERRPSCVANPAHRTLQCAVASKPDLLRPFVVTDGSAFRLKNYDPGDTAGLPPEMKARAKALLQEGVTRMAALQARLYAQDRWGVLLIFQAMDAAGKDGAIEHVMSGVNPQGCQVHAFKAPSLEELDHDFLWRTARALPERGRIGIFNRSYYEEVLIVRVHPGILRGQHVPHRLMTKRIWKERLEDIAAHERYLSRNGYVIRKFFLHV
jgi:polyphosphate kinase 2 (PPK2 family)